MLQEWFEASRYAQKLSPNLSKTPRRKEAIDSFYFCLFSYSLSLFYWIVSHSLIHPWSLSYLFQILVSSLSILIISVT